MKKIVLMSLVTSSLVMASGYKIPETSTNSVALSGANIAHVKSADAAYDNPANMIFMSDNNYMEAGLMYVGMSATNYKDTAGTVDIDADKQSFAIPSLHYVSPKLGDNDVRVGVSVVVPGGLSRKWQDQPAKASAEEFTLEVVEVNPTAAFSVTDKLAVAVGFRIVHSSGVVKATPSDNPAYLISQDMTGDSTDFGYNLALAYHPTTNIEVGITYRSLVNLTEEGTADLQYPDLLDGTYDVSVSVPLPATFSAAIAYTLPTKTTIELVYEKTYWSTYTDINFEYTDPTAEAVFGGVQAKKWKDTNAFRLGITQELDSLTLMAGVVIDETPTPETTLNFESPGSDSVSVSLGGCYAINDSIDVALSALYSIKDDRRIDGTVNENGIDGEFTNSNVLLISAGVGYKF